VVESQLVFQ